MRRVLLLALCVSGALALTACPSKPKNGECKSSQDCAEQSGYGKVCVDGRCQECGADTDCQTGFVCKDNKCSPKAQCQGDLDCPAGQACQGERCVARAAGTCGSDRDCTGGATCQAGKCVAASSSEVPAECEDAARFTIRFGFDQATLTGESQGTLQALSDCLKAAPARRVTVQGNADERGTAQYNLALGARRADAARKYLSDLGVAGSIDTVSFGEDRPVCRQANEECWAKNRRDDFVIDR